MGVHVLDEIKAGKTAANQKVRDFLLHSKTIHVILVVLLIIDGLICLVCGVLETNYLHGKGDDCMAHVDLCNPMVHHRRLDHDLHTPLEGLPWLTDYEIDPETSPRQFAGRSLSSAASGSESAASGSHSVASGSKSAASGSHSAASGSHSVASGSKSAASGSDSAASGSHAASTVAYKGSMTVKASVTATQMATAMKKTLAHEFSVKESEVEVIVTEGHRRLEESSATPRQLAGTWAIAFTITAPAAQAAAIQSKVTSLSSNSASMKTQMTTQLKAAGASDADANSMTMASLTIAKADTSGSQSGGGHAVSARYQGLDATCGTHVHFGDHDLHNAEKTLTYISIAILVIFFLEQVALIAELRMEYCKPMFLLDFFVICSALAIEVLVTQMAVGGLLVLARTWRFARVGHGMIEIQQNSSEVMECDNEVDCMMTAWEKLPDARWRAIRKADNCHILEEQGDFSKLELEIVAQLGESPAVALRALAYAKAYKEHCDKNPRSAHHLVASKSLASNSNAKNAV